MISTSYRQLAHIVKRLTMPVATTPSRSLKRLLDLVCALPIAALFAVPLAAVSIGSAIAFRAWPFFVQRREGEGGRDFTIVKIRSLQKSAPPEHAKNEPDVIQTNAFGRLIRRYHVDEMTQVFQVLSGHMSLVGPRPEMLSLIERYSDEQLEARRAFKPGLTGLWQLSPDASRMMYEVPEYDLCYASNWSLRLDIWILFLTAMQPLRSVTPRLFRWVERHTLALCRAETH